MAEAVFKDIVDQHLLKSKFGKIDSAGTAGYHIGDPPDSRTIDVCKAHRVPIDHVGQQLSIRDFEEYDWILVMDHDNLRNVERLRPQNSKTQVGLFGHFAGDGDPVIQDPYYGDILGFEKNYKQITDASIGFLSHLGFSLQN